MAAVFGNGTGVYHGIFKGTDMMAFLKAVLPADSEVRLLTFSFSCRPTESTRFGKMPNDLRKLK